jgi:hypothetical protein
MTLGGGGGGGANDGNIYPGYEGTGSGGSGGGIIVVFARNLVVKVAGSIVATGGNGGNAQPDFGGGGAGAGGSILLTVATADLGTNRVLARGGIGGTIGPPYNVQDGGSGGAGRIRVQYCETTTGSTDPPASVAALVTGINTDGEVRPNGPNLDGDDATWPRHDDVGDACDTDDDNDGLSDPEEFSGESCSGIRTDPRNLDTDGDHLTDGWECANGSNPTDAGSKFLGSGTADADGDRAFDFWERRGYGASGTGADEDGDGCADLVEIASVDGNKSLTDVDRISVARRALGIWGPDAAQDYVLDIDKNGSVNDVDRIFVARAVLLPDWLPKSCP